MPAEVTLQTGSAALGARWAIRSTGLAEDAQATMLLAQEATACFGWHWRVAPAAAQSRTIELRSIQPSSSEPALFAKQGYRLLVTPGHIVIEGATAQGRFYGVQTLRQLLRASPNGVIPCLHIRDYPALEWRGISDDISRGQVSTVEDFKAIVRQLAYYKLNLYQLYLEDMFVFRDSRADGHPPGALTRDDLEAIVAEGRRNHVVVSPIFETLAHQERLLGRQEHQPFAAGSPRARRVTSITEAWSALGGLARDLQRRLMPQAGDAANSSAAFSTADPQALSHVEGLVDEIVDVTRGPFFHLGGDEWQPPAPLTETASARHAADDGLASYGRYLGHLANHLRERYGCEAMVYSDVILAHPEAAEDLPRSVVVVDWHYDAQDSFPSLDQLRAQGFQDVMVSPALWTWRAFYPNYASGFRNVAGFAQAGKLSGAMGCITAAWSDDGAENLRENNWPGYAYSAAASWESAAPAIDPFLRHYVAAQFGLDSAALARALRLLGWQEFEGIGWSGLLYHRPLVVRPRPQPFVARMEALRADMDAVERSLLAETPRVRLHADQLAAAALCARTYAYIAERELLLDRVGRMLTNRTEAQWTAEERDEAVRSLGHMEETCASLRRELAPLWLSHNAPAGLAENLQRMEMQDVMLRRLGDLTRTGLLSLDTSYARLQALSTDRGLR
jgi:hypothetical protein